MLVATFPFLREKEGIPRIIKALHLNKCFNILLQFGLMNIKMQS